MLVISTIKKEFQQIRFDSFEVEHDPDLCLDIDYLGWVGDKAFGIQIKHVTVNSYQDDYTVSDRMQNSFRDFQEIFGGQVFVIYKANNKIINKEVFNKIASEIERLSS